MKRSLAMGRLLFLFLFIFLASCGNDTKGQMPIADFHAAYMKALCEREVRCHDAPDEATCLVAFDLIAPSSAYATVLAGADGDNVAYDPAAAASCFDSTRARPCDSTLATVNEACARIFVGTVAPGGDCRLDIECTSGQCKAADPGCTHECCPGTCATPPVVAHLGETCSAGQRCADGTRCGEAGVCAPLIDGPGTSCSSSNDCVFPLACEGAKGCLPLAPPGGACDPQRTFPCADAEETYCDPTSRTCAARKAPGEACAISNPANAIGSCVLYALCDSTTSKCVPQGTPGAACVSAIGDTCLGVLICDAASQTCTAPPAGVACM